MAQRRTLTRARHYNLVFLHARRKTFPAFDDIAAALQEVWPWGEVASIEEIEHRLTGNFPESLVEAAIWKVIGESAAQGHLLLDLEQFTLSHTLPLALLPSSAPPLVPGAQQTQVAKDAGIPRSTLSRLIKRTKSLGAIACVPYGSYTRTTTMHPAFQECIRRLYACKIGQAFS